MSLERPKGSKLLPLYIEKPDVRYRQLDGLLVKTKEAFENGQIADSIITDTLDIVEVASSIEGYAACFGVGYPYYARRQDGGLIKTPTISQFLTEFREEQTQPVMQKSEGGEQVWPCPHCQESGGIPADVASIQTFCNPCGISEVKPRGFFRALPDTDIFLVFDKVTPEIEKKVSSKLREQLGVDYCETNMRDSITNMERYFAGDREAKLPIDLHILSTSDFYRVCAEMSIDPQSLPDIPARANYLQWHDRPIEVRRDFLFSMTPVGEIDPNIQYSFDIALQDVATNNDTLDLIDTLHARMQHLLRETEDYGLMFNFINRINAMKTRQVKPIRRMPWDPDYKRSAFIN